MDSIKHWMDAAGKRKMSKEETQEAFKKLHKLDKASAEYHRIANKICEGNLLLIVKCVHSITKSRKSIKWGDTTSLDLLQAGFAGLLVAVNRYDPSRASFSTCAYPWIRQRINRYIIQYENIIRIPENVYREAQHMKITGKASERIHKPKTKDLIDHAYKAMSVISLDLPAGDPEYGSTIIENIACINNTLIDDEDDSEAKRKIEEIHKLIKSANLNTRLRETVCSYLETGTIAATAKANGIVPDTVKQRLKAAITRMQAVA